MTKQVIRLHRTGSYITTGNVTIDCDGHPFTYQRKDETRLYLFDWSDYFTRDAETVTVTIAESRCTATKVDGTDSATITVSSPSEGQCYVKVTVAITGGDTFVMKLNIEGEGTE